MFEYIPLYVDDLISAAFWAAVIVVLIRLIGWAFRMLISHTRHIAFDPAKLEEVRKSCKHLFPIENLKFNGTTFKRGTIVRVITRKQDSIEGEFLGTNGNNMMCLVTQESIIAQELHAIETIQAIGRKAGWVA
ncbi:MAG: hypothetical protein FWC16_07685 [Defluviitaleaceae bacterium]|nr:hypothetical protein [Defluviitaleaceae bacterium]MCL2274796.1 hypothetical protein [Defluviitaleaceae bacterium]